MRTWILAALALAGGGFAAHGQDQKPSAEEVARSYQRQFQQALTAHQAGKYDESIAGFKSCHDLVPEDEASAYNVACGYSMKKELDPAFEWLEKSIDLGFGRLNIESDQLALAKKDADLENLRADERFAKALERMTSRAKAVETYTGQPFVHVPAALAGAEGVPVLVVLHAQSSTKEAVGQSFWKAIAEELGLALIAPSGRIPAGDDPAQGMGWIDNPATYQQGAWKYEKTIQAAVDAFGKQHKIDRSRVYIAGEGEGGSVAFNAAIGAPGQYKGVVVLDAPVLMSLAAPKAANASKAGFRGRIFLGGSVYSQPPDADVAALAESTGKALQSAGLANVVVTKYAPDASDPDQRKKLALGALSELLAPADPAEAGAQK